MSTTTTYVTKTCNKHGVCSHTEKSGCTACTAEKRAAATTNSLLKCDESGVLTKFCVNCDSMQECYTSSSNACKRCKRESTANRKRARLAAAVPHMPGDAACKCDDCVKAHDRVVKAQLYQAKKARAEANGYSYDDLLFYESLPEAAKLPQELINLLATDNAATTKIVYGAIAHLTINKPISKVMYDVLVSTPTQQGRDYGIEFDAMVLRVKSGVEAGHWPLCASAVARAKMRIVTLDEVLAHESKFFDSDGNLVYTFTFEKMANGWSKITSLSDNFWPLYEALFEDVMAYFFSRVRDQQLRVLHEAPIMTELRAIVANTRENGFYPTLKVKDYDQDSDRYKMTYGFYTMRFCTNTFGRTNFFKGAKYLHDSFAAAKKDWADYYY